MGLYKQQLLFDPADVDAGDNVGAFLRAGDDGDLISSTNVGGKEGLDVNIVNSLTLAGSYAEDTAAADGDVLIGAGVQRHDANTTTVSADGDYSLMHVNAFGGLKTALISAAGIDLAISVAGEAGVIMGATSGVFAEDDAHVSGDKGHFMLAVRNDAAATTLTSANGDYSPVAVDNKGRLLVAADFSVSSDYVYPEDSASADGDELASIGGVRQDSLASSTSTDGDYGNLKQNSRGALWVAPVGTVDDSSADTEFPVKVGAKAYTGATALAAVANSNRVNLATDLYRRVWVNDAPSISLVTTKVTVGTTEVALPTTPAAGRRRILIQNISDAIIYIGPAGVTTSGTTQGLSIAKGGMLELPCGQSVVMKAIAANAGKDVIVFEMA